MTKKRFQTRLPQSNIKDLTAEQKLIQAQAEIALAEEKELKEVTAHVVSYLKDRGYTIQPIITLTNDSVKASAKIVKLKK